MSGLRLAFVCLCTYTIALAGEPNPEPNPEPKPPQVEPADPTDLSEIVEIDAQGRIVRHNTGIQDPISGRFRGLPIQRGQDVEGFKLGNDVVVHPLADVLISYDDNVLGTRKAIAEEDVVGDFMPGFQLRYEPNRKFLVNLFYQFGWHDYFCDEARDYLSHRAAFDLNVLDIGDVRGLDFGIRERYHQTSNIGVLEDQFFSFRRLHGNNVGPFMQYENNRHIVNAEYEYGIVDYFSRASETLDYETHRGFMRYGYKVNKRVQPYVRYEYLNLNFDSGSGDFETHEGRAGVLLVFKRWTLDFNIGGIAIQANDHEGEHDAGIVTRARMEYQFDKQFSMYAMAGYEMQEQVLTGASKTTTGELGLLWRPTRKIRVDALFRYIGDDRENEDQSTIQAGAGATYQVTRNFHVEGRYLHSNRDSDTFVDVEINQGTLGFHLRF